MTIPNNPLATGLMPDRRIDGAKWGDILRPYLIPAAQTNAIYVGDPIIKLAAAASLVDGTPACDLATAGGANQITGVVCGFLGTTAAGIGGVAAASTFGFSGTPGNIYRPAATALDWYALVNDDPEAEFVVMSSDNVAIPTAAIVGKNVSLVAGAGNPTPAGAAGSSTPTPPPRRRPCSSVSRAFCRRSTTPWVSPTADSLARSTTTPNCRTNRASKPCAPPPSLSLKGPPDGRCYHPLNHPDAQWPGVLQWFGLNYDEFPDIYSQIFDEIDGELATERLIEATGFGLARRKTEASPITYDADGEGYADPGHPVRDRARLSGHAGGVGGQPLRRGLHASLGKLGVLHAHHHRIGPRQRVGERLLQQLHVRRRPAASLQRPPHQVGAPVQPPNRERGLQRGQPGGHDQAGLPGAEQPGPFKSPCARAS